MKQTWAYIPSINESTESKLNVELIEKSEDLYEEAAYVKAIHTLLDGLNETFREKYGNSEGTHFKIPHGSILINILIKEEELEIFADFLEIPEKGRVAMLRQIANLNAQELLLVSFIKEHNLLKIVYKTPLSLSHPHKIYGVLKDICIIGDKYDDELCAKFNAKRCYEPMITPCSSKELDQIYNGIQSVGGKAIEEINKFMADRDYGYAWGTTAIAIYQIQYFAAFQGQLDNEITEIIEELEGDKPLPELVNKGLNFLKKLCTLSPEELEKESYHVDILVSPKHRSSLQNMQKNMIDPYRGANEAIQNEQYETAVLRLLLIIYKAFYYNDMQDKLTQHLTKALKASAEKPLKEASKILYEAVDDILEDRLDEEEDLDFDVDMDQVNSLLGKNVQKMQAAYANMGSDEIQDLQQKMMQAMSKGDMDEYSKIALELQQKMMNMYSNNDQE